MRKKQIAKSVKANPPSMEQAIQRQKAADDIPSDIFEIDFHIYKKDDGNNQSKNNSCKELCLYRRFIIWLEI